MNKKTLTKLEYHKIIDILIEQATSFGGKERCKRLKPMTSLPDINTAQEQTAAAFTRIIRKGSRCSSWKRGTPAHLQAFGKCRTDQSLRPS